MILNKRLCDSKKTTPEGMVKVQEDYLLFMMRDHMRVRHEMSGQGL